MRRRRSILIGLLFLSNIKDRFLAAEVSNERDSVEFAVTVDQPIDASINNTYTTI